MLAIVCCFLVLSGADGGFKHIKVCIFYQLDLAMGDLANFTAVRENVARLGAICGLFKGFRA